MSSTTKKIKIDPNSRKIVDELKTTNDLYRDVANYERQLKSENSRRQKTLVRAIEETGNELMKEVENKHKKKEEDRIAMIERIHKLTGEKVVTLRESQNLPIEDLKPFLIIAEEKGKPWYSNVLDFLMGWDDKAN